MGKRALTDGNVLCLLACLGHYSPTLGIYTIETLFVFHVHALFEDFTYNWPFSPLSLPSCCSSLMWLSWSSTFCLSAAMLLSPLLARSSLQRPLPSFCSCNWSCFVLSSSSGERLPSSLMRMTGDVKSVRRAIVGWARRKSGVRRRRVMFVIGASWG